MTPTRKQCDSGISRVYELCNRYESGYGHGIKRDGLDLSKTPHADAEMGEAYQIGYEAGSERYVEPNQARSDDGTELLYDLNHELTIRKDACGLLGEDRLFPLLTRAIAALSAPSPVRSDEPVAWQFSRLTSQGRFSDLSFDEPKKSSEIDYIEPLCLCSPAPSHVAHDGMVSVPIEPTDEMVKAGREVFGEHVEDTDADYKRIYAAMIAIAGKEV